MSHLERDEPGVSQNARVEWLETRQLFAAFGADAGSATDSLTDGDGTIVTLTLAGPGSGTVEAGDDGQLNLSLRGTTGASSLTLKTDGGGDGRATLGSVEIEGALRLLAGKTADLRGDLTASGAVRRVWLNEALGGVISAPAFGEVRTNGDLTSDVRTWGRAGIIAVGGSASDLVVRAARIDRIDIRGGFANSKVLILPTAGGGDGAGLDRLSVHGAMRATRVNAIGNIGSVTVGAMFDSEVVAGVRFDEAAPAAGVFEPVLPIERENDKAFDFTGRYSIGSVAVSAAVKDPGGFAFADSRIAAYRLGSIKLAAVNPENGGRLFGASGYYVKRIQRRFAGPDGAALTAREEPRTDRFFAHQIYEKLVFNPDTGTYTGGSGGSGVIISGGYHGGTSAGPVVNLPAEGVQIGTVADHSTATTIWLTVDGTYDARDAQGTVIANNATIGGLAVEVVGTPGVSIKMVMGSEPPPSGVTSTDPWATLTFLATSVGLEMKVNVRSHAASLFMNAAHSRYRLPTAVPTAETIAALGVAIQVYTTPLLKLRDMPVMVGRRFDDEHGVKSVTVTPAFTFETIGADAVSHPAPSLAAALLGDVEFVGAGREPARLHQGSTGLTLSGLGDGGTAVLYVADRAAVNAAGATLDFPNQFALNLQVRGLGVEVRTYRE